LVLGDTERGSFQPMVGQQFEVIGCEHLEAGLDPRAFHMLYHPFTSVTVPDASVLFVLDAIGHSDIRVQRECLCKFEPSGSIW
ncbi:MAG: hypothetical protein ABR555_17565, partial [Pyrinomonadaceae bacterium]